MIKPFLKMMLPVLVVSCIYWVTLSYDASAVESSGLKYEDLTPVSEETIDFACMQILDANLKSDVKHRMQLDPWNPETNEIKGIIKVPIYDLNDRIYQYIILGYNGKGDTPSLEELNAVIQDQWDKRLKLFCDDNIEPLDKERQPKWDVINKFVEEEKERIDDKWMYMHLYSYLEFSPFGTVNEGVSYLYIVPLVTAKLRVQFPGEEVEFVCLREINREVYFEYSINGERRFTKFKDLENLAGVYSITDFMDIINFPEGVGIKNIESNKESWQMFLEKDMNAIDKYKSDLDANTHVIYGMDGLQGIVPDFYNRYQSGCQIGAAASVLAYLP